MAVPEVEVPKVEPDRAASLPVPPVTPPSTESKSAAEVYLEHKGSVPSSLARRSPEEPDSTETSTGQALPPQLQQILLRTLLWLTQPYGRQCFVAARRRWVPRSASTPWQTVPWEYSSLQFDNMAGSQYVWA